MEGSSEAGCFAWLVDDVNGLEMGFSAELGDGSQERWEGFPLSEV